MKSKPKKLKIISIAPTPARKTIAQAYADSVPVTPVLKFKNDAGEESFIAAVTATGGLRFPTLYSGELTGTGAVQLAHWILDTFDKEI